MEREGRRLDLANSRSSPTNGRISNGSIRSGEGGKKRRPMPSSMTWTRYAGIMIART